jgi:hypothetical protein
MAGQVKDGVEDPFVGDAFVANDFYELAAEALVPVSIFECSHFILLFPSRVQDKRFAKYLI